MSLSYDNILIELEKRYGKLNWNELIQELMASIAKASSVKVAQDTLNIWSEITQLRNMYLPSLEVKKKRGRKTKEYTLEQQEKIDKEIQDNIAADKSILELELAAKEYPLGEKEFWRHEMVGNWLYGLDQHPMTNDEFEQEWAERENV